MYAATQHALLIATEWLRDEAQGDPFAVHALLPARCTHRWLHDSNAAVFGGRYGAAE